MEARNFITAREMITDGNWLLTTMNGEPRYQKPPLPTWLAAISALIFGAKSLFAYRLPGIIMVVVMANTIYNFSHKICRDKFQAFINALILITSFYVVAIVIEAPWDIFTHGFMLIGIYYLYLLFQHSNNNWFNSLMAGLFIGCSILSKGPVSPYALFLPFLIAYGFTFKFKDFKQIAFPFLVAIIFAVIIGGWWYLYVRLEDPDTFLKIASKETGNWASYNVRPFYYYWSFFTQSGIWTIPAFIGLLYPYLKTRVSHLKVYQFTLLWTIVTVVLLSIIPEKKSRYLMPVLIPLALNTGFYIEYLIRRFKDVKDRRESLPVYFNFGLIAIIGMVFGLVGYFYFKSYVSVNWLRFGFTAIVLAIIGFNIFNSLYKKNMQNVFFLIIGFVLSVFVLIAPLNSGFKNNSHNAISSLSNEAYNQDIKIYVLDYISPEMIWHYGTSITVLKTVDSKFELPSEDKFGLLVNKQDALDFESLKSNYDLEEITVYDLNRVPTDSKQWNKRLTNTYYMFTKK